MAVTETTSTPTELRLDIEGMTCAAARRVEKALEKVDGVKGERESRHRACHGRFRPGEDVA